MDRTPSNDTPPPDSQRTEPIDGLAREVMTKKAWLRVIAGDGEGRSFAAGGDRSVVGTHESANIRLEDRAVSRFHCEITFGPQDVRVRDLGSRNGTFVDGVRVETGFLHDGAVLSVGATRLQLTTSADAQRMPVSHATEFGSLVGVSLAMRRVFALLDDAARSDVTVLLSGETGTGKDVAAEAIHARSARASGPFIVVDCASLSSTLLESELFGHEKGSFTGAAGRRVGAFEAAQGGTVFLDEIGEMPLDLQPKLLRVLEQKRVRRVGQNDYSEVDVRVLAATNRDLRSEVNAKRFRSDLYYRLAVLEIEMPPLRARPEDIPLIAARLLERRGAAERAIEVLSAPDVVTKLKHDPWVGNVRELRNYLERCLARRSMEAPSPAEPSVDAPEGPETIDPRAPFKTERDRWMRTFEARYLKALMAENGGNVSAAARAANLDRVYFYRLLWRHGLR